ncbi:hypothetical protein GS399_07285 [Pedobacter sp. HMF7647]|uniref:ABC transporter substrate-binding protein n=1 Tax=Hufsiella arboris TaxID=2695275 RepID=A0A7K1Y864_9SPHI|nr:hypothetical protein [Hufsiella arboris]MXV50772.1 hypothetical protein [Hufsiella arboris]
MENLSRAVYKEILSGNEELEDLVNLVRHKLKFIEQKPKVLLISNLNPVEFSSETDLVSLAGGQSAGAFENPSEADVIIISPQGSSLGNSLQNISSLLSESWWSASRAAVQNKVYIFDSTNDDPVNALESLAEMINPKQFVFGHEGEKWVRFGV